MKEVAIGEIFGRLTVLSVHEKCRVVRSYLCQCECGKTVVVRKYNLLHGITKSCGCLRAEMLESNKTHGYNGTAFYRAWQGMKSRVKYPSCESYPLYGGRGISYDPAWEVFEAFLNDMLEGYSEGMSLDRIDPNKNYYKENCRWVPPQDQGRNRRMRKDNTSGITGVSHCAVKNAYIARWMDNGKFKSRSFSVNIYGDAALGLAILAREEALQKLIEKGIGYTEYHGK